MKDKKEGKGKERKGKKKKRENIASDINSRVNLFSTSHDEFASKAATARNLQSPDPLLAALGDVGLFVDEVESQ